MNAARRMMMRKRSVILLADDFNDGVINPVIWNVQTGAVVESNSMISVRNSGGTGQVESRPGIDKQDFTINIDIMFSNTNQTISGADIFVNLWGANSSYLNTALLTIGAFLYGPSLGLRCGAYSNNIGPVLASNTLYAVKWQFDFTNNKMMVFVGGVQRCSVALSTALPINIANLTKLSFGIDNGSPSDLMYMGNVVITAGIN